MMFFIAAIIVGLVLLLWSADRFIDGTSNIARNLGISPLIIGMLIIGFGTSAPEMIVSATASFNGNPSLGIGNALGSNITNITLVLGVTALFFILPVQQRLIRKEIPLVLGTAIVSLILLLDGYFSRLDGIILIIIMVGVLAWMIYSVKKDRATNTPSTDAIDLDLPDEMPLKQSIMWSVFGLVLLLISSNLLVYGASNIASLLGVSDLIIGLTIVAIGTSLPELAATISSARKGETDLAVGNIVGSNLFNTLTVLPLPGLIHPLIVPEDVLNRDIWVMLACTVLLLVFCFGLSEKSRFKITRLKGAFLLATFIAYQALLYFQTV